MPASIPPDLELTTGEAHDNRLVSGLLSDLKSGALLLADRGYDADWIRALVSERGAWANIPPKRNRKDPICFSPYLVFRSEADMPFRAGTCRLLMLERTFER
jgi:transposase